jgi:ribosomal protein S18 acetylase RimI-like enzyme
MLSRAFFNDPLYTYIFPEPAVRAERLAWDLGKVAHYGLRFGVGYATATLNGCAICLPPGETDFTEARMAAVGMLDSAKYIGAQAEGRMMIFVNESEQYHRQVAPSRHWYLVVLGVDPPAQGRGLGTALLTHLCQQADADRVPIYLETAEAHNVRYYQKFGFTVRAAGALSHDGIYLWYLVRDANQHSNQKVPG